MRNVTAIILGGGLGTRLRSVVADRPKVLAPVAGRPFLDYLLEQLVAAQVSEVILSTGFMADAIEATYGGFYGDLPIAYAQEEAPLGTGGAIKFAARCANHDTLLVMNGDSIVNMPLGSVLDFHQARDNDGTFVLVHVDDTSRFGSVKVGPDQRILGFHEKSASRGSGLINGGIYVLRKSLLADIPAEPSSFERQLAPEWIRTKTIRGLRTNAEFIDIGVPESYAVSHELLGDLNRA